MKNFSINTPTTPKYIWSPIQKCGIHCVGFKIGVTKYARNHGIDFAWQTRFYDHIVRNEKAYNRILFYIQNNINQWNKDSLKP